MNQTIPGIGQEVLDDVMSIASGGGINYWVHHIDSFAFPITITQLGDDLYGPGKEVVLTAQALAQEVAKAFEAAGADDMEDFLCDTDACGADTLVQLACFGEQIYA